MKAYLLGLGDHLRTSFWFVPSLMAIAAMGLCYGTIWLDRSPLGPALSGSIAWLWSGGADGGPVAAFDSGQLHDHRGWHRVLDHDRCADSGEFAVRTSAAAQFH